ncbi:MAG TPA: SIS domain-containing protein [Bryobacteraceae bacterium]|nr:SIS domain-containing protein [Bryobacteraceae bacterium]
MSRMLDEIREQPAALERTLRSERQTCQSLSRLIEARRPRLVLLAARGTSDNAAVFGRYLLEITTGIPVSLAAPSIFTLYGGASFDFRDTLVVALSQSGESTDTNLVAQRAREAGALTVGVTNEAGSALAQIAEHVILVQAGREQSVAATKTYTGQLLTQYLLARCLGAPVPMDRLERLPEYAAKALELETAVAECAERYTYMNRAVSIARGLNYANAFEFALKLMETCYVVAERFSSADLLHGPIAMVESAFPAFLFAPAGVTWAGLRDMTDKLVQLGSETLAITDRSNPEARRAAARSICIESDLAESGSALPTEVWTPVPYIIPAQLFAAHLATHKRLDPDQPRTLSKVTRTL